MLLKRIEAKTLPEAIDRVRSAYAHLTDDDFVAEHVDRWRS